MLLCLCLFVSCETVTYGSSCIVGHVTFIEIGGMEVAFTRTSVAVIGTVYSPGGSKQGPLMQRDV